MSKVLQRVQQHPGIADSLPRGDASAQDLSQVASKIEKIVEVFRINA